MSYGRGPGGIVDGGDTAGAGRGSDELQIPDRLDFNKEVNGNWWH